MQILSINLKSFRCFESFEMKLEYPLIGIIGKNGTGKTSILEAMHYMCYLRSFKTHSYKELINLNSTGCSINLNLSNNLAFDRLQVTLINNKRSVKLNEKNITTYNELYNNYKIITISEEDMEIVKGAPQVRRSFIDQMLIILDPTYIQLLKRHKIIVDNRNALLNGLKIDNDSYELWSHQLLESSIKISAMRKEILNSLSKLANELINSLTNLDISLAIDYQFARDIGDYTKLKTTISTQFPHLLEKERRYKRSLFGAHLDDFVCIFQQKASRTYASRGQQKFIVFLLKLAQISFIKQNGQSCILLIDDFISDFDEQKVTILLDFSTQIASQIIITTPISNGPLVDYLNLKNAHIINLL